MLRGIRNFVGEVATMPSRPVWYWGDKPSILAFIVFHLFAIARLFSPLQWVKLCHRKFKQRWSVSHRSRRPNFHALYTEVYFLAVLGLSLALYVGSEGLFDERWLFAGWHIYPLHAFAYLMVFETGLWALYYLFIRNFAEPGYTLYHRSEYFVLFPVVLAVQILNLGLLFDQPAGELAQAIFVGGSDLPDRLAHPLRALGLIYTIIVIGNLRQMYPSTEFKTFPQFSVIGAGDVVSRRVIPALRALRIGTDRYRLHALPGSDAAGPIKASDVHLMPETAIKARASAEGHPVYIATSTGAHADYIRHCFENGLRFAVEKPIVARPTEIADLQAKAAAWFSNGFALSYYSLEKALTLRWVFDRVEAHAPLIRVSGNLPSPENLVARLGNLNSGELYLLETDARSPSPSRRAWTEQAEEGGLLFETGVHLFMLLEKVSGPLSKWRPEAVKLGSSDSSVVQDATTLIDTTLTSGDGARVRLVAGKYMPVDRAQRSARFEFEHGSIATDFETGETVLTLGEGGKETVVRLEIRPKYRTPYAVQMYLMLKFFREGWAGERYDELEDQIPVLAWLSEQDTLQAPASWAYGDTISEDACPRDMA